MAETDRLKWFYLDKVGAEWGPFGNSQMWSWFVQGVFKVGSELLVRLDNWSECEPVRALFPDGNPFATRPLLTHFLEGQDEAAPARKRRLAPAKEPPAKYNRPEPPQGPPPDEAGAIYGTPGVPRPPPDWPLNYGARVYPPHGYGYGPPPPAYGYLPPGAYPPSPAYGYPPPGYGYPLVGYGYPPAYPQHGRGGKEGGRGEDGRYYGRIKSYNDTTGFGFIDCAAASAEFGRDVFVQRQTIGTLKAGDDCSFTVELASDRKGKRMPQARDVQGVGISAPSRDQRFVGRVKSLNEDRGFGFADCPEAFEFWQRDVFIHKGYMVDLEVGDEISFFVEVGKKGMPQARELEPARHIQETCGPKTKREKTKKRTAGNEGEGETPAQAKAKARARVKAKAKAYQGRQPITVPEKDRTTILMKNIPSTCSRADLVEMLADVGFDGQFDFVYLQSSSRSLSSAGCAFVNMTSHDAAVAILKETNGWDGWVSDDFESKLEVSWSPAQGLESCIERYRNSPVMHRSVPDDVKPVLFDAGSEIPFPEPTAPIEAPHSRPPASEGGSRAGGSDEECGGPPVEEDDILDWLRRTSPEGDDDSGSGRKDVRDALDSHPTLADED